MISILKINKKIDNEKRGNDLVGEVARLYKKVESKEVILSVAQKNAILALRQDYVEEQTEMTKKFMRKEIDILKDKQLQLQR